MSKLILITGGARSGKSTLAENKAKELGKNILYVATATAFDDEMKQRIKLHRQQRPQNWQTVEAYKDLGNNIGKHIKNVDGVLLDCVTVMITNLMMDEMSDFDNIKDCEAVEFEAVVESEISKIIEFSKSIDKTIIIVTNEVGMGIVPFYASTRLFRDVAGRANQKLAFAADEVYLCTCGIPLKIK